MNERRRFLQVVGGGTVALAAGCSAGGARVGASGAGGTGSGGAGAGGSPGTGGATSDSSSSSSSSTASSSSTSSGSMCETNPVGTKLGKPSAWASDGLHIVSNSGVLVGRDAKGLYALSAICTHRGCDMSSGAGFLTGGDIQCLCHGSLFGPTGDVVNGPASIPLSAYAMELGCDGDCYVDENKIVANTVRLDV